MEWSSVVVGVLAGLGSVEIVTDAVASQLSQTLVGLISLLGAVAGSLAWSWVKHLRDKWGQSGEDVSK